MASLRHEHRIALLMNNHAVALQEHGYHKIALETFRTAMVLMKDAQCQSRVSRSALDCKLQRVVQQLANVTQTKGCDQTLTSRISDNADASSVVLALKHYDPS